MSLTERDVRFALELMLGRKNPNAKRVQKLVQTCDSVAKLRRRLAAAPEFETAAGDGTNAGALRFAAAGAPSIETDVPPADLQRLLDHVEQVWRKFGETEPHWSVLTNNRYRQDELGKYKDEFYGSGEKDVQRFRWALERAGLKLDAFKSCLELGSGAGRVTLALAKVFDTVVGADISSAHLAVAAEEAARRGVSNIAFRRVATVQELDDLPECDAFFSVITLQHSPPPVMKLVLQKVLDRLRPGGVGYFQLPTTLLGYEFTVAGFLDGQAQEKDMEHHCLPQPVLFDVIARSGCRVLECAHDTKSKKGKISNTMTVQKVLADGH